MSHRTRSSRHLRIGVFIDFVYRQNHGRLSVDQAVLRYITALAPRVQEIVLFGRLTENETQAPYEVPTNGVTFVALPHYESVAHVGGLLSSVRRACRIFARELHTVDVVWLFGPHPLAIAFARVAKRRNVPVVLCVRQDFPRYIAGRVSRVNRTWAIPVAWAHEIAFRTMARTTPTTVVGEDLALHYRAAHRAHVETIGISLVSTAEIVSEEVALRRDWDCTELRLLTVGRLDPEKNPLLLVDIFRTLYSRDSRWRLDVVGDGPMLDALVERSRRAGLEDIVRFHGHVANGPALNALYRAAHTFLHVSFTEGLPQVLFEAMAAGIPIVATDVGGVRRALLDGRAGLLIPPGDALAAVNALERVRDNSGLRSSLTASELAVAQTTTIERSHDQVLGLMLEHIMTDDAVSDRG